MKVGLMTSRIAAIATLSFAFVLGQALEAQTVTAKQQTQPAAGENAFTGVISDSMCGATHMAKDKSAAECTRMCVQQGQKYALVVGKKVYTLQGHEAELDKLAGQRVSIKGTASGDTLTVNSVMPVKKKTTT